MWWSISICNYVVYKLINVPSLSEAVSEHAVHRPNMSYARLSVSTGQAREVKLERSSKPNTYMYSYCKIQLQYGQYWLARQGKPNTYTVELDVQ